MTRSDFAPLFRTAIGFDRLAQLMDTAASAAEMPNYPPYNIEKTGEDTYRLTMAVAGFRPEDLQMVVTDNNLVVSGPTFRRRRVSRCCIVASPGAPSSDASSSPTTWWSMGRTCKTACCMWA